MGHGLGHLSSQRRRLLLLGALEPVAFGEQRGGGAVPCAEGGVARRDGLGEMDADFGFVSLRLTNLAFPNPTTLPLPLPLTCLHWASMRM